MRHANGIGSRYDTENVDSRQERKDMRARASLQALDRGSFGCAMSSVDMVRAMTGLLRAHQSEVEMQVHCSTAVRYQQYTYNTWRIAAVLL